VQAADALLPMIEDLLMQHAPPEPSDHKVQMSSLEHAIVRTSDFFKPCHISHQIRKQHEKSAFVPVLS